MKKTLALLLTLLFVLGTFSVAFADFNDIYSDVPTNHWSYAAVKKLAQAGIVTGYGDGTFQGNRALTRYEMAQIIANALTKLDKADAENKALINKLASEYADELKKLDVRVSKLEDFRKNTIRIRFDTNLSFGFDSPPSNIPKVADNDRFHWRTRLWFNGDLNEKTKYTGRLTTSFGTFGMNSTDAGNNSTPYFDMAYLTSSDVLGFDTIQYGRQGVSLLGGLVSKGGNSDGVTLTKKLSDKTTLKMAAVDVSKQITETSTSSGHGQTLNFIELTSQVTPELKIGGMFIDNNVKVPMNTTGWGYSNNGSKIAGVSALYKMGGLMLLGEYDWAHVKDVENGTSYGDYNGTAKSSANAWAFQITNGTGWNKTFYPYQMCVVNLRKPGDNAFVLSYHKVEAGATPYSLGAWRNTVGTSTAYTLAGGKYTDGVDNLKGWTVSYQYVLQKDLVLSLDFQKLNRADNGHFFDKVFGIGISSYLY